MVQSAEQTTYVAPRDGDPQLGDLMTPITDTPAIKLFINWLPINRPGVAPMTRGLEVGMAHGYWLVGPFTKLGPLRAEAVGQVTGLLAACAIVLLMTMALQIYGYVTELKDTPVGDSEGWSAFAGGFLIGGVGGAVVAYLLLANSELVLSGFNLAL